MKKILIFLSIILGGFCTVQAQPEGVGQTGGMQLLFNTWGRSSGFMGLNVASSDGIESTTVNPAGLGTTQGTELVFANTNWLIGSEIRGNSFGFSQAIGGGSVLGLSVNALSMGDFIRTTVNNPDGTLGTFSPSMVNLGVSYAKQFTDNIYVGTTIRILSESTPEVSAGGVSFDAGIQYRAGDKDKVKLGISLRNVGPTMSFGGDGLSFRVLLRNRNNYDSGVELPTAEFELPVVLSLGGSYDFLLGPSNTITVLATYLSNSYYWNQGGLGLQYKYKDFFMIRGAYLVEEADFSGGMSFDAHTGLAVGATVQAPFKAGRKNAEGGDAYSFFGLDISYRTTNPFGGTLTIGARIDL
jgi:hypothetical protein